MLIVGFSKGDFKIRHYSSIFMTVFMIYGAYQAYLFGVLLPQVSLSNSSILRASASDSAGNTSITSPFTL